MHYPLWSVVAVEHKNMALFVWSSQLTNHDTLLWLSKPLKPREAICLKCKKPPVPGHYFMQWSQGQAIWECIIVWGSISGDRLVSGNETCTLNLRSVQNKLKDGWKWSRRLNNIYEGSHFTNMSYSWLVIFLWMAHFVLFTGCSTKRIELLGSEPFWFVILLRVGYSQNPWTFSSMLGR